MKGREITAVLAVAIAFFVLLFAALSFAIDPPHTATPDANVSCVNCHNPGINLSQPGMDNTPINIICRNCHKAAR